MLDALVDPNQIARGKTSALFRLFIIAFIASLVSIAIMARTFTEHTGVLANAFILIVFLPMIHRIFVLERGKEIILMSFKRYSFFGFILRHKILIITYLILLLGVAFGFATGYVVFGKASPSLFKSQINVLSQTEAVKKESLPVTGATAGEISETAKKEQEVAGKEKKKFWMVFFFLLKNNITVVTIAILLSFLYASGGLFLIFWNASILGVLLGYEVVRTQGIFTALYNFILILPHGMFEMVGYFVGGIAGTVLSMALFEIKERGEASYILVMDTLWLVLLAALFILIGACIEALLISHIL